MDYMGKDSFDNIWAKICQTLEGKESEEAAQHPAEPPPSTAVLVDRNQQPLPEQPAPKEAAQPPPTVTAAAPQQPTAPSAEAPRPQPTDPGTAVSQPLLPTTPPQPSAPTTAEQQQQPSLSISEVVLTAPAPTVPQQQSSLPPTEASPPIAPKLPDSAAPTKISESKPSDSEYISTLPAEPPVRSAEEDDIIFSKPSEPPQPSLPLTKEQEEALIGKSAEAPIAVCKEGVKTNVSATVPTAPPSKVPSTTSAAAPIAVGEEEAKTDAPATVPTAPSAVPLTTSTAPQVGIIPATPTTPVGTEVPLPAASPTVAIPEAVSGAPPTVPSAGTPAAAPTVAGQDASARTAASISETAPMIAGKEEVPPGIPSTALMVFTEAQAGNVKLSDILEPKKATGEKTCEEKNLEGNAEGKEAEPTNPIPLPPIPEPSGAPGEKKTKSAPRVEHAPTESDPSHSENQSPSAKTSRSDSLKDDGKQKKGVFTKILEIVGVSPKTKKENNGDVSKSVFYDVEGAASSREEAKDEGVSQAPEKPEGDKPQIEEPRILGEPAKTEPSTDEFVGGQIEPAAEAYNLEIKPEVPTEGEKGKSMPKPARNLKDPHTKGKSPSPKLSMPAKQEHVPGTAVTMPTPTVLPDTAKELRNPALLKVDDTILDTPPVPDPEKLSGPPTEAFGAKSAAEGTPKSEIQEIFRKAQGEAESRLQADQTAGVEQREAGEGDSREPINAMKLITGEEEVKNKGKSREGKPRRKSTDNKQPPKKSPSKKEEVEELKVTTAEERQKHKGEVASSKLSDQILKAIPPPRRKAISESKTEDSPSTGAIPKTNPLEAVPPEDKKVNIVTDKPAEGGSKSSGGKQGKPSSIPVPPPRSKPKPPQPTPPKAKPKK